MDNEYNNVAVVNSNEVGVYTVDLSNKNIIIEDESFCTINDEIDEGELLNSPSKVNYGFEHFAKLKENINNIKTNEDFFLY